MIVKIAVFLMLTSLSLAQISAGNCPNIKSVIPSFDANKFVGKWYEIAKSKFIPFAKESCVTQIFSFNTNGSLKIESSDFNGKTKTTDVGEATKTADPFKYKFSFKQLFKIDREIQILDTDYQNYALLYNCSGVAIARTEYVWIYSRTPELSPEIYTKLINYINSNLKIKTDRLQLTNQSKAYCNYQ